MAGQPLTIGDGSGPEVIELSSVPGFVVFDLPGVPESAGGTRLAPDVSLAEVMLLARAMTYKYAALGAQMGGAKAGVRGDPADHAGKAALMARFCAEIAPLTVTGRLLTGPDMGTAEEDFAPLRERRAAPAAIRAVMDGVPFEDLLTGFGVAVAAEAALGHRWGGGWDGRSVAIEGFGKVGGGVAREVTRRGGRVAAVSTVAGCVMDPAGLDTERLLALRRTHGDACVLHYGRTAGPPGELFTAVDADVVNETPRRGVRTGMQTWDAITSRRNVRSFADRPIPAADLDRILEAGRRAPSSQNWQPWDFIVVTDREQLRELARVWRGAGHVAGSAATIVVIGPAADNEFHRAQLDLGQATMAMLLAAADLGIGSCHAGVADLPLARALLGFPEDRDWALLISLGYPADRPLVPIRHPKRRPFSEVVHCGRW